MTTLNFPHQDDNNWLMIDVGGQKKPQYPSPLEVKMLIEEAVRRMQERCAVEVWLTWQEEVAHPLEDTPTTRALSKATNRIRSLIPNHQD